MAVLREDGVAEEKITLRYEAALQYEGQTHRVIVPLSSPNVTVDNLAEAYLNEYRLRYGVTVDDVPIRLVNLRLRATAPRRSTEDRRQKWLGFQRHRRGPRAHVLRQPLA